MEQDRAYLSPPPLGMATVFTFCCASMSPPYTSANSLSLQDTLLDQNHLQWDILREENDLTSSISNLYDTLAVNITEITTQRSTQAALKPGATLSLLESEQNAAPDSRPNIGLSLYAEDFNNKTPLWANTGYSGFSMNLSAEYLHQLTPDKSAKLTLEFARSASSYSLSTTEAWFALQLPGNESRVTVGTQATFDPRGWFYDSTLDMVSAQFAADEWSLSVGAGKAHQYYPLDLWSESPLHWMVKTTHQLNKTHMLSVILSAEKDSSSISDNKQSDIGWLGLQTAGPVWSDVNNGLNYWAQLGLMSGREKSFETGIEEQAPLWTSGRNRGWAYDVGATLSTSLPGNPELTLSFANSSGDADPSDNIDFHYRQSGISSNSADIGSATGLSYYGNAIAPGLTNLRIISAGVTLPFLSSSYVSVFARHYHQINPALWLESISIDLPLTGLSHNIGHALDVDLSLWESPDWYASLSLGFFYPGSAVATPHPEISYGLFEINRQF